MKPPPEVPFASLTRWRRRAALFGGSDFARNAGVIERGHVHQEAAGQGDVAGDARAFLAERFLGDLDDDFLALLEHVRDELSAARRLRAMAVPAAVAVLRTAAAIVAASATFPAAARWILHARAKIIADAGLNGLRRGPAKIFAGQT